MLRSQSAQNGALEVPWRPLGRALEASGLMLELWGVCWRLWESTLGLSGWPRDSPGVLQGPVLCAKSWKVKFIPSLICFLVLAAISRY